MKVNPFFTLHLLPRAGDYTSVNANAKSCNLVNHLFYFQLHAGQNGVEKAGKRWVTVSLVYRKLSKLQEASGRKRNSQYNTLTRSKINSETETLLENFISDGNLRGTKCATG